MATSARKEFPVFDCDSHVVEPPSVWDEYVPAKSRAWVKTQFCFHTDSDLLFINGRVVPAARERSNAAEVGWARWDKKEVGKLTPGTDAWQAFQRDNRLIRDPVEVFNERCFIGFESDETLVYRLWDVFQDVAIWSSDYPHHDAEDAWDGLHHMAEFGVPAEAQQKLMGENARRLYGIEPVLTVHERIETYEPAILPW
jgi:hypothetical protein